MLPVLNKLLLYNHYFLLQSFRRDSCFFSSWDPTLEFWFLFPPLLATDLLFADGRHSSYICSNYFFSTHVFIGNHTLSVDKCIYFTMSFLQSLPRITFFPINVLFSLDVCTSITAGLLNTKFTSKFFSGTHAGDYVPYAAWCLCAGYILTSAS